MDSSSFIIYRIRSRYLQCMKDGVGERLITLNPTTLNVPAFKNAGWGAAQDIRRTYSPPIPSGTTGEYFTSATAGRTLQDSTTQLGVHVGDDGGVVLGSHFSGDSQEGGAKTPRPGTANKDRAVHHREDDDSSDMSDDSDDDEQKYVLPVPLSTRVSLIILVWISPRKNSSSIFRRKSSRTVHVLALPPSEICPRCY
jgi:hypothetical protein